MDAFFVPDGPSRFAATALTRGPWDADAQHAGPPAALLGRAIERCEPRPDTFIARLTFDILRPVPIAPLEVSARVVRPGRSVQLLEASLTAEGAEVMRAAAWRIRAVAGAVADVGVRAPPPGPETVAAAEDFPWSADVGYHTAMEWRFLHGGFLQPGPAAAWLRMRCSLVAGEDPSPLSRVLAAADSGNGVSGVVDFSTHYAINTDLSVYLHGLPVGEWVCLDAETTVASHGVGLAVSTISDERSVIGRGLQSLYVGPR